MSLQNLVGISLEKINPDADTLQRLKESALRALQDAQVEGMSNEGKFDCAYRAIMQTANRVLQANGYRTLTSKPGHHQTMIQTLSLTMDLPKPTVIVLDSLRKQRNVIDYTGDIVTQSMAQEAVEHAKQLIALADQWFQKNKL
jgi:hypothetical protein